MPFSRLRLTALIAGLHAVCWAGLAGLLCFAILIAGGSEFVDDVFSWLLVALATTFVLRGALCFTDLPGAIAVGAVTIAPVLLGVYGLRPEYARAPAHWFVPLYLPLPVAAAVAILSVLGGLVAIYHGIGSSSYAYRRKDFGVEMGL